MESRYLDQRRLRNLAIILALAATSVALALMVEYRYQRTASWRYTFMTWNLALAWIPVAAAFVADEASRSAWRPLRWIGIPLAMLWLLFLPNAPYLATDLIHLEPSYLVPFWYDAAMMFGFAATGVVLGLASLAFMQDSVRRLAGSTLSWLFTLGAIFFSAFGVYLGRFQRLNSWEVFSEPSLVVREVLNHLQNPSDLARAYEFTLLAGGCLLLTYAALILAARTSLRLLPRRR
jgi:uncharacterized membrane protein